MTLGKGRGVTKSSPASVRYLAGCAWFMAAKERCGTGWIPLERDHGKLGNRANGCYRSPKRKRQDCLLCYFLDSELRQKIFPELLGKKLLFGPRMVEG